MTCIPPNPRRVGYMDPIHGLTYTPTESVLIIVGYTWLELFPRTGRKHQVIIILLCQLSVNKLVSSLLARYHDHAK